MFMSFWEEKENWQPLKRQLVNVLLGKSFDDLLCFSVWLFLDIVTEFRHHVPMYQAYCMPWCQFLKNLWQPPHPRWKKRTHPCLSPRMLVSGKRLVEGKRVMPEFQISHLRNMFMVVRENIISFPSKILIHNLQSFGGH